MTVTFDLQPHLEQKLVIQAQERGVSLDAYLEPVLTNLAVADPSSVDRLEAFGIPLLHLGVLGELRRTDLYDDVSDAS